MRDECEAKVNLYVQELIKTKEEQAEQLKFLKENANKNRWIAPRSCKKKIHQNDL